MTYTFAIHYEEESVHSKAHIHIHSSLNFDLYLTCVDTAAIPSKRDLLALMKAVQNEFLVTIIEGDHGLLQLVCREFQKTVKLMLSKIEDMVLHTADTRKISSNNSFARNHAQDHNGQLMKLLIEFREALSKIPDALLSACAESSSGSLSAAATAAAASGGGSGGGGGAAAATAVASSSAAATTQLQRAQQRAAAEVGRSVHTAALWIDELAERQILFYVVELLSGYARSVLLTMTKEGVSSSGSSSIIAATAAAVEADSLADCSTAVQTLAKQVPAMLKAHLLCLPKCAAVQVAIEEFCVRLMHNYITVAALLRPQSEALRLRTAKDLTALESILSGIYIVPDGHLCPVMRECR